MFHGLFHGGWLVGEEVAEEEEEVPVAEGDEEGFEGEAGEAGEVVLHGDLHGGL